MRLHRMERLDRRNLVGKMRHYSGTYEKMPDKELWLVETSNRKEVSRKDGNKNVKKRS
jgi:hypothetical protein